MQLATFSVSWETNRLRINVVLIEANQQVSKSLSEFVSWLVRFFNSIPTH